jgi:hypothetical protein
LIFSTHSTYSTRLEIAVSVFSSLDSRVWLLRGGSLKVVEESLRLTVTCGLWMKGKERARMEAKEADETILLIDRVS